MQCLFVLLLFLGLISLSHQTVQLDTAEWSGVTGPPPATTKWTDVRELGVLGRGWDASTLSSPYTRFPTKAKSSLCSEQPCQGRCPTPACEQNRCAVWSLSQSSIGLHVRFSTTATSIHVRWQAKPEDGDWLWALNGHSGVDFYVQDSNITGSEWRWATSSGNNPGAINGAMHNYQTNNGSVTFTATLGVMEATSIPRNFTLYLPSRGSTLAVEVGVAPDESPPVGLKPPETATKPVVVYGTSILHAAGSGRAGMVYSSQMERYIQKPVINLGFSGHGLMQREVGHLLAELSPSVYVLDCEYNMDSYDEATVACLTYDFIKILRKV